jgi:hypothetical protein
MRGFCLLFALAAACGDDATGMDAARPDGGGGADAGLDAARDAAGMDAAGTDAGGEDGSAGDSGDGLDAAVPEDAAGLCEDFYRFSHDTGATGDGTVSFDLRRCIRLCPAGGCEAYAFYYALRHDGTTHTASRREQIEYTVTHHNWQDSAVATLADRRIRWRTDFELDTGDVIYFVSSETLDGTPILPETLIAP